MRSFADALGPIPHLDGAACKDRPEWFEVGLSLPIAVMHRMQERALHVCASCPVLQACRDWTRPDGNSAMWAQGGMPMFDVKGRERRRKRDQVLKRKRGAAARSESARIQAEAKALLEDYREVPR